MQGRKNSEKPFFPFVLCLIWTIIVIVLFAWSRHRDTSSIATVALHQARAFVDLTISTRLWNAEHGGVFISVTQNTPPNPYLDVSDREVITTDGLRLAKINPAYMTRLISEVINKRKVVQLHITSLNPIQPANAPDDWEAQALRSIKAGEREQFGFTESEKEESMFRYFSPLFAEKACLPCHEQQKVKEGDLMGGLSISIPSTGLKTLRRSHLIELASIYFFIWLLGIGAGAGGMRYLRKRKRVEEGLRTMSLVDELTGLNNRRGFFLLAEQAIKGVQRSRKGAALFYLDLDNMKWINDTLGHREGDLGLMDTAMLLKKIFRESDILGRLGGDEFVVFATETSSGIDLESLPARVNEQLESHNRHAGRRYELQMSIGHSHCEPCSSVSLEELLKVADALMYEKKAKKKASAPQESSSK